MHRDMELIRTILLEIEGHPTPRVEGILEIAGVEPGVMIYHMTLLLEAGLIDAHEISDANTAYGYYMQDAKLTWSGHEFLETVRNPEVWIKTKSGAAKLGSWTLGLLGDLAKGAIRQEAIKLGIPMA